MTYNIKLRSSLCTVQSHSNIILDLLGKPNCYISSNNPGLRPLLRIILDMGRLLNAPL